MAEKDETREQTVSGADPQLREQPARREMSGEETWRALADAAEDAVAIHDGDVVLAVNAACCVMHGHAGPDEIVGRPFLDFVAPEVRADVLEKARAGGAGTYESLGLRADASTFPTEIRVRPIVFRGRHARAVNIRDITERKRTEAERDARLAELEAIFGGAPVGLCLHDRDLRIVTLNEVMVQINGRSAADTVGRTVADILPPELAGPIMEMQRRVLETGEPAIGLETRGSTPAALGLMRDWLVNYTPVRGPGGTVTGIAVAVLDITARKNAERRARFLTDLDRTLRPLADPAAVTMAAAEALCRHLGAGRAGYWEVEADGEHFTITRDWGAPASGLPSGAGRHRFADFGPELVALLRRGETVAVFDTATDPRAKGNGGGFDAAGHRSTLTVPLVKDGRLAAGLFIIERLPRVWTPEEVALAEAVAERIWAEAARARAEAALRESEARFRDMADGAPVMVWVTGPSGRCTYLNRFWYRFTGQSPDEGLGFGWLDAIHPDDRPIAERTFRGANEREEPYRVEFRLRRADGAWRWAIDAAAPRFSPDGSFLGYVGCAIDITEIREAEEALRASEERFRLLANLVPAFVWFGNPDGTVTYLNDRWYEYTGQTAAEALPNGWADTLHPDDAARTAVVWADARARGDTYEIEVRYRHHDGEYRWYLARAEPLRESGSDGGGQDGGGRITGWFGTSTDIHDRKMAEEALRTLNATLEERVAGEVEERERAQAALLQAQKTEALGQLTGGVAHDFNNLLQALRGCLQMVGRRVQDPKVAPLLEAGNQAVDRGAKLVQQLMAFARRQALRPEPVDVRDRVLGMSELLTRALRADIRMETDFAPGLWPVEVDPTQFELALLNLAVNARDAMPDGGTLTVRAANVTHSPESPGSDGTGPGGLTGDFLRLTVSDTGIGMPPDVLARAFDPFFTTKDVGKGSGLGLSQVYGFARHSGGTAWIESGEGRGATVHLLLRRSASTPASGGERSPVTVVNAVRQGRVLVVEDDPVVAMTVGTALEEAGFTVSRAATADEALPLLAAGGVDVLFSDVVMPGSMSGVDLAREAKRLHPGLPVVLTTGYSEDIARATGVRVLPKPYRIDALVRLLDSALAGAVRDDGPGDGPA